MTVDDWSYVRANPSQLDGFEAYLKGPSLMPFVQTEATSFHSHRQWSQGDFFSRFPVEIISILLSLLPTNDLCALRLASRAVAHISTVDVLPQSFWYSRFGPGFERQFALQLFAALQAAEHGRYVNWRECYFAVRRALNNPDGFPPLQNRKRIWTELDVPFRTIELLLANDGMQGTVTSWEVFPLDSMESELRVNCDQVIEGDITAGIYSFPPFRACLELEVRLLDAPPSLVLGEYVIGISSIMLSDGPFVSGVAQYYVSKGACITKSLGLINKASETLFLVKTGDILEGFEVAVCSEGIVDLTPIIHDPNYPDLGYVARNEIQKPGVSLAKLVPQRGQQILSLIVGLDVRTFPKKSISLIYVVVF
jgi:hypothetical protein